MQGKIRQCSCYEPLQLFSSDPHQQRQALQALLHNPQNNLSVRVRPAHSALAWGHRSVQDAFDLQLDAAGCLLYPSVADAACRQALLLDAVLVRLVPDAHTIVGCMHAHNHLRGQMSNCMPLACIWRMLWCMRRLSPRV